MKFNNIIITILLIHCSIVFANDEDIENTPAKEKLVEVLEGGFNSDYFGGSGYLNFIGKHYDHYMYYHNMFDTYEKLEEYIGKDAMNSLGWLNLESVTSRQIRRELLQRDSDGQLIFKNIEGYVNASVQLFNSDMKITFLIMIFNTSIDERVELG